MRPKIARTWAHDYTPWSGFWGHDALTPQQARRMRRMARRPASGEEVEGMSERLELRYVPLSTLMRWDRNHKRHDLGGIAESIARHGFRDPPAYDATLNGGHGGIVEGNGRGDALSAMRAQGHPPPRGIVAGADDWLVPVLFGLDAASQAAAESYAVDHNNLTMAGGDFTDLDMARMWDADGYAALLSDLAAQGESPVSIDETALDALLAALAEPGVVPGVEARAALEAGLPTPGVLGADDVVDKGDRSGTSPWERVEASDTIRCLIGDIEFGVPVDLARAWSKWCNEQDGTVREVAATWLSQHMQSLTQP